MIKKMVNGELGIIMGKDIIKEIIKLVAPQLNIPIQNSFNAFQEHVRADIQ